MKQFFIWMGLVLGFLIALLALDLLGLEWTSFIGPKRANIQREIFEESKSYTHGKIQELAKYKKEWESASIDEKEAIESLICSQFASFDETNINPQDLKNFLQQVRGY